MGSAIPDKVVLGYNKNTSWACSWEEVSETSYFLISASAWLPSMVGPDVDVSVSQINSSLFKLLLASVIQWQQKSKGDTCWEVFSMLPFLLPTMPQWAISTMDFNHLCGNRSWPVSRMDDQTHIYWKGLSWDFCYAERIIKAIFPHKQPCRSKWDVISPFTISYNGNLRKKFPSLGFSFENKNT